VLIHEFKQATGRLGYVNHRQRATSIVAVWEFLHGARGALLARDERVARQSWLADQGITPLRLHQDCSKSFESLLQTDGPPSVADSLLAAECLARGVPVVTLNVRDFAPVRRLRYVAW
jgi:predicted nucleic acid-binding protein